MSSKRYPEEFKIEAVRQVTDRGHSVAQVADQAEIRRLHKELKRVTEERDILKKAAAYFASQSD